MARATRTVARPGRSAAVRSAIRSARPVIVIDTREQLPYEFPCDTVRAKLDSGDYSLLGYEHVVAVERKRPVELFTCFGVDRDRFEQEFIRLSTYRRALVVIEGTMSECSVIPSQWSRLKPSVIIHSLMAWYCRYGVSHVFAENRENAEAYTYGFLARHFFELMVEENASTIAATTPAESQPA